jgi:exodeoxyribonuclease-3
MRIASWNVNSIRARVDAAVAWVAANRPDVLCLQELKIVDEHFPHAPFAALGYEAAVFGQKTYNGVAILARQPMAEVTRGFANLGNVETSPEARIIAATVQGVRIHSVYVPNGQTIQSDRYAHKLKWLAQLTTHVQAGDHSIPWLLCGDFNVAPEERDLYNAVAFENDVIFHRDVRQAYATLIQTGLVDTFRLHHPEPGHFSWWDYRMLAVQKNRGLRIDLMLADRALVPSVVATGIDREARKGPLPSDHAPIWVELDLNRLVAPPPSSTPTSPVPAAS